MTATAPLIKPIFATLGAQWADLGPTRPENPRNFPRAASTDGESILLLGLPQYNALSGGHLTGKRCPIHLRWRGPGSLLFFDAFSDGQPEAT